MLFAILLALHQPSAERTAVSAISAAGEIYVIGGAPREGHKREAGLDVLDPKTNRWRRAEPLPLARTFGAVTITGRHILFAGGLDPDLKTVNRADLYDLIGRKWLPPLEMPVAVSRFSADMWGLECVFTGGIEMHGDMHVNSKVVQMYNRRLSSWSRGPDLPVGVHGHTTTVLGDAIYVVGGVKGEKSDISADILAYTRKEGWKRVGALPEARMFHGTVAYKSCLYVFGNRGPRAHPMKFDPKTGKTTPLKCPDIDNHRFAYARHGERVYFFGGDGPDVKDRVFDLSTESWVN